MPMSDQWIDVEQGQCAESLAYQAGHLLDSVWNHPDNASLKALRENPHTLLPKDRLFIPAITAKSEDCATDQRYRFRRKEVPSRVVIRLYEGKALANLPFELQVGDQVFKGQTDAEGTLRVPVMPDAADGQLLIDPDGKNLRLTVGMRHLDPIGETTGVQGRLRNLGFYRGPQDGLYSQALAFSIQRFQQSQGLATTGRLDDQLRQALEAAHGS